MKVRRALESKSWLTDYVKFRLADAYSSVNGKAYEYLVDTILGIREQTASLTRGLTVHSVAEELIRKGECECPEDLAQYRDNISRLLAVIRENYPDVHAVEHVFRVPLAKLIETDEDLIFGERCVQTVTLSHRGLEDNKDTGYGRSIQLEAYKGFCLANDLDPDRPNR
jgi:hypothetical protein